MSLEFERTETHETRYTGTLTGQQIAEFVKGALRDKIGANYHGLSLTVEVSGHADGCAFPDVRFALVHDHDWYMKDEIDPAR